jgi:hypothetical protein
MLTLNHKILATQNKGAEVHFVYVIYVSQ